MQVKMLKSKIHRAIITDVSLHYEGSITIPHKLAEMAGLLEHEKVLVANVASGARFETYVILGDEKAFCLNGAAAHLGKPGDKVIIMSWASMDAEEAKGFSPRVVVVGDDNQPKT